MDVKDEESRKEFQTRRVVLEFLQAGSIEMKQRDRVFRPAILPARIPVKYR